MMQLTQSDTGVTILSFPVFLLKGGFHFCPTREGCLVNRSFLIRRIQNCRSEAVVGLKERYIFYDPYTLYLQVCAFVCRLSWEFVD